MSQATLEHVSASHLKHVPVLKPGYTVKVHQRIREGEKERIQMFEGLVIKIGSGNGINKTFIVRKMVDGIGVEKSFPLHSPNIDKIEIVKYGKVRRAKLYYMRDLSGKSARLRDKTIGEIEMLGAPETPEAPEAPETEEVAEEAPAPAEEKPVEETKTEEAPAEEAKEEEKTEE